MPRLDYPSSHDCSSDNCRILQMQPCTEPTFIVIWPGKERITAPSGASDIGNDLVTVEQVTMWLLVDHRDEQSDWTAIEPWLGWPGLDCAGWAVEGGGESRRYYASGSEAYEARTALIDEWRGRTEQNNA